MRELTVMEMDAVLGGSRNSSGGNGKSFVQNFAQCVLDTAIGAAAGTAMGGPVVGSVVAVAANLASDACNALPAPY